jgi:hypothetical protein
MIPSAPSNTQPPEQSRQKDLVVLIGFIIAALSLFVTVGLLSQAVVHQWLFKTQENPYNKYYSITGIKEKDAPKTNADLIRLLKKSSPMAQRLDQNKNVTSNGLSLEQNLENEAAYFATLAPEILNKKRQVLVKIIKKDAQLTARDRILNVRRSDQDKFLTRIIQTLFSLAAVLVLWRRLDFNKKNPSQG